MLSESSTEASGNSNSKGPGARFTTYLRTNLGKRRIKCDLGKS